MRSQPRFSLPILGLSIALLLTSARGGTNPPGLAFLREKAADPNVTVLPSGLLYKVLHASTNSKALSPYNDSACYCNYRGTTINGTLIDTSEIYHRALKFHPKDVIRGWTEALLLMKEGDKWELYIPSELAYGDHAKGKLIPPGSVLVFELELVKVVHEGIAQKFLSTLFSLFYSN